MEKYRADFCPFTYRAVCDIMHISMKGFDLVETIEKNFRVFDVSCNVVACLRLFHGERSIYI